MHISWKKYIDKTSDRPPRPLLVEALQYVKEKKEALDLGAGALMDSKHLLGEGFSHVTAIDNDSASEERAKMIDSQNFSFIRTRFEDFLFPKNSYDLVNAQRTLSYIQPEQFKHVLNAVMLSLKPGGIFVGQIFGDRDQSILPGVTLTYLTKVQIQDIFSGMEILKMEEFEEDKLSTLGRPKHFHEFHLIVRNPYAKK